MNRIIPLSIITVALGATGTARADQAPAAAVTATSPRVNSVNVSPLGLFLGSYTVNYERLMGSHGLLVEGAFANQSNNDATSRNGGINVGYRWHWRGKQNSGFLGVTAGFSMGTGTGTVDSNGMSKSFDVNTRIFSVTGNVGKRWAMDNGLNLTLRIGAGYGNYDVSTDSTDPDAQGAVDVVNNLLTWLPVAFDGELSLGYTF